MPTSATARESLVRDPATQERGRVRPPAGARAPGAVSNAGLARLARAGGSPPGAGVHAWSNRVARSSLAVTHPDDPVEREAERVASDVVHRRTVVAPAAAPVTPPSTPAGRTRSGQAPTTAARPAAREADSGPAVAPPVAEAGSVVAHAEEVAAGGQVEVPQSVTSLIASPGTGVPMGPAVQARVAPVLGADLSTVRVHQGPEASAAAAALQARAFTVGADIFLGEGASPTDLELMAHESTHVVQQQAVGVYRAEVARLALGTLMPDDLIRDVQAIPGYSIVSVVVGSDPITGESATESRQAFVEKLLTFGPFGAASGPVLQAAKVLDDVFTMLDEGLKRHNLTFARVLDDLDSAWEEMRIAEGIDFNLAIARRYLSAVVNDVKAFLSEIADAVIAKVRSVLAAVAEPLLEKESIAPYWNLAKKVLRTNPLTGEDVPATTVEILTEFLKVAGQQKVLDQMVERGTLQKTADWVDSKIDQFKGIVGQVGALLEQAGAALNPANLPNLLETLPALADKAFSIIKQIGDFAQDVLAQVLVLVKDSLMGWLSSYARKIPGYDLLTVILEKDPFTEAKVPRTAENLIKGFILLLPGGDGMYAKLAESGVIANAAGRIESAMTELNISWELITETFQGVWNLVTLDKLLTPTATFDEILAKFGDPLDRIITFAAVVIRVVVELILRLMNFPPEILGRIIDNAMAAIDDIKKDPVGFLINVLEAMKRGFGAFFDKIAGYLLKGLSDWMFRGLRTLGIEPPAELTLQAAITLVIQVSGVTVESLWAKLGAKIGEDKVAKIREAIGLAGEAFAFIKDIKDRGIEAIWERISEQLSNLWDLIFDAAKQWLMSEIIDKAVAKVLSMLDPTGIMAVVRSAQAIFNAIQSVMEYARELLELVDSYVSTVASIAKGDVAPGAAMLEKGLANAVPVAIGFLANQAGVGDLPEKVKEIVVGLRLKIDEAIDWLLDKAISLGKAALDALGMGDPEQPPEAEPAAPTDDGFDKDFLVGTERHELTVENGVQEIHVHSDGDVDAKKAVPETGPIVQAILALLKQQVPEEKKIAHAKAVKVQVDKLKALLIAHPELWASLTLTNLGHAPNIGVIAPYKVDDPGWQPKNEADKLKLPLWELTAEHVVPDMYVTDLLATLTLAATTGKEYGSMHTIMIYKGAAAEKTSKDHEDRSGIAAQVAKAKFDPPEIDSDSDEPVPDIVGDAKRADEQVWTKFVELSALSNTRTVTAIGDEADATIEGLPNKSGEMRGGGLRPTLADIKKNTTKQIADIDKIRSVGREERLKAYEAWEIAEVLGKAVKKARKAVRKATAELQAATDPSDKTAAQTKLDLCEKALKDAIDAKVAAKDAQAAKKLATQPA